jgi:predicted DNA repair protein MutK
VASASLLTLIDDIATLLDDVSMMTKVAARKTAGVLGDDLALNAQQVTGVRAERELPVVWAVAKGSFLNKCILIPAALVISAFLPGLVTVLLMMGGAYLCYEGAEKVVHKLFHSAEKKARHAEQLRALRDENTDMRVFEKDKIKGAIRTDFILSAEIIVITLGTAAGASLGMQLAVLVAIGLLITIGVYGLVAGIVKLDDLGLYLVKRGGAMEGVGHALVKGTPWLMKTLGVVGTLAMFLVGGGILVHGVPALHHMVQGVADADLAVPAVDAIVNGVGPVMINLLVGLVVGGLLVAAFTLFQRLRGADDGINGSGGGAAH